jgi:hypothetical protein
VKVYETELADAMSVTGECMMSRQRSPIWRATSSRQNGVSSEVVPVFSPGGGEKKKATKTMASRSGEVDVSNALWRM